MSVAPLLPRPRGLRLGHERVEAREPAQVLGASLPAQGYRVVIDASAVRIDAADEAGAFYARATLDQLARTHGGRLPVGEIVDWPDVAIRGVMLDISRDKVPSFSTLAELVDRLASWKLNQLELYTEHTFAYTGHEEVWENAS
ncbi:partial N,N'-diacetylchitobiase, partial [Gammaproteobacteria bacterium]